MVAAACGVPTAANRHRDQVNQSHSKEEKLPAQAGGRTNHLPNALDTLVEGIAEVIARSAIPRYSLPIRIHCSWNSINNSKQTLLFPHNSQ
eukprot:4345689-Prymnesium_polylepis.1